MTYSPLFQKAVGLALELHNEQKRKGTDIPYVTHLFSVAALVGEHGGTETEVIAALLHDAVEDQGGPATLMRIRREFGDDVAEIVAGCSDTDEVPKPPWKKRKQDYIDRLSDESRSVMLVSAADKLHNARCTLQDVREHGEVTWERFSGSRDDTIWYYRSLLEIYEQHLDLALVRTLSEVVHDLATEGHEYDRRRPVG